MFEMKEEFYTGISIVDQEHAELFRIAQTAMELYRDPFVVDKYDGIMAIVEELKEYAKLHFAHEEEYMESIQYKRLFSQKIDHNQFMEKLNHIDLQAIDNNQDEYIVELLNFLNDWLVHHILEKDKLIPVE